MTSDTNGHGVTTRRKGRIRVTATELRAEARAWRRQARMYDDGQPRAFGPFGRDWADEVAHRMNERHAAHWDACFSVREPVCEVDGVLACLFLALECEDEAEEARAHAAYCRAIASEQY